MKSMTGYGKSTCLKENYQIIVEIKSVNHRFLDTVIRMPREFNAVEMKLKNMTKKYLNRGRVECFVTVKKEADAYQTMEIKWGLLDKLVKELDEAEETRYADHHFSAKKILSGAINHPSLFEVVESDEVDEQLEIDLLTTFEEAVRALDKSRLEEGTGIKEYFVTYKKEIESAVEKIRGQAEIFEAEHQEKLEKKVMDLVGDKIDEPRILTEVALLIEKGDINEELDRLILHLKKFESLIQNEASIGKELDFLIQEMNREVNTIGSKSTTIAIKEQVVFLKTVIEKIREQVQNIE
ncbi:YicC/YloC family endoribonuclease [Vagococcus fluvialis]|uniref:YicC/YloC family endoribonuclease n=1 Tax=Vagococcus fluvialis TaxID=2738 RepID=UPI001A8C0045|nr:YicC/YloC family endoribonuclease [Vagococcus fluvialis]MBO0438309.1 YicC family protein [Vagococcus fluvialis]